MLRPFNHQRWTLMLLLFVIAFACTRATAANQKSAAHTYNITIKGFQFHPDAIMVKVGDTIIWKNDDFVSHTVTDAGGKFDSGEIKPNATWRLVAKKTGTFKYHCDPHPNMHATLIVQ